MTAEGGAATGPRRAVRRAPVDEPVLPERANEDSDVAWGDYRRDSDEDERLHRERPPHWE